MNGGTCSIIGECWLDNVPFVRQLLYSIFAYVVSF